MHFYLNIWNVRRLLNGKSPSSLFEVAYSRAGAHSLLLFYLTKKKSTYIDYCLFNFNRQGGVAAAYPTHNREEARFNS